MFSQAGVGTAVWECRVKRTTHREQTRDSTQGRIRTLRAATTVLLLSGSLATVVHPAAIDTGIDTNGLDSPLVAEESIRSVSATVALAPNARSAPSAEVRRINDDSPRVPPTDDVPTASTNACPSGMLEVASEYCPVVEQICIKFIGPPARDRCAEFRPTSRCIGATTRLHFCIDRFEYPNLKGAAPMVSLSWDGAQDLCEVSGKRLCTDSEWTLACEGEERTAFPYGQTRDSTICNIDRSYVVPDDAAYANTGTREAESTRLSQAEVAGNRPECVSKFGVHDLTGNVDEWVVNERGSLTAMPFISGLKGGYWGPVRNRCRPMTVDHNQWHTGYQIGFRCCSDPLVGSDESPLPRDEAVATGSKTAADDSDDGISAEALECLAN